MITINLPYNFISKYPNMMTTYVDDSAEFLYSLTSKKKYTISILQYNLLTIHSDLCTLNIIFV